MTSFMLDTNCLVALFSLLHPEHQRVTNGAERRFSAGQELRVAGHTLAETYAVLTRMPPPHRVSAATALSVLDENLAGLAVTWLEAADYWAVLSRAAERGIVGGAIYDALIAETAYKAGVAELVTLNLSDLRRVAPAGLTLTLP